MCVRDRQPVLITRAEGPSSGSSITRSEGMARSKRSRENLKLGSCGSEHGAPPVSDETRQSEVG